MGVLIDDRNAIEIQDGRTPSVCQSSVVSRQCFGHVVVDGRRGLTLAELPVPLDRADHPSVL
jgi:hypothetical protein